MKKSKILFFILGALVFSLSACNASNENSGESNDPIPSHEHTYSSSWNYDNTYHWHDATCGHDVVSSKERHTFNDVVTPASYSAGGYTTHTCTVCGYSYIDSQTDKLSIAITWKNYDGTILETDTNVPYGSTPSYDGPTPLKPSDSQYDYSWNGWDPAISPAIANQTYTATFSYSKIVVEYNISFDLNGGSSPSYKGPQVVQSFTEDIFFFDCVKDGWNFRGWSYNGTKIFDEKGTLLSIPEMSENMVFVAIFAQTAKMTIITNMNAAGVISGEGEYPYNTYVDISAHPYQGYVFVGWYYGDTLLSNTEDYKYMMWDQDVSLEARFKLDSFLISISSNNENYGLVLLRSTYNFDYLPSYDEYRDYTSQIQISAYSKTDVRFLGWYDNENSLVSPNAVFSFVMPNHDYYLEAKWNYFKVEYDLHGGINNDNNPNHYTIDDNAISLYTPTRDGYTFIGWKYNDNYITSIDTKLMKNIHLDAVWEAKTYSITYHLDGGTNNSNNPDTYTIENSTITLKSPEKTGYEFCGWFLDSQFNNEINQITGGTFGDIEIYAKWNLIVYSISYDLDGGSIDGDNPTSYTIEASSDLFSPYKKGYTFVGWYDQFNNKIDSIIPGMFGDLTLSAVYSSNQYTVSFDSNGGTSCDDMHFYYDSNYNLPTPEKSNYLFDGWYYNNDFVDMSGIWNFDSDIELTAHWISIPSYNSQSSTITFGTYPQSVVHDSSVVSQLEDIEASADGYIHYLGQKYEKVVANCYTSGDGYRYQKFDNDETVVVGNTYYFLVEPIVWRVLDNNGSLFLMSDVVLDQHIYNDAYDGLRDGYYANNYKNSSIREWINEDFFKKAFSYGEQQWILETLVDNSEASVTPKGSSYCCEDTNDKVFLPSYADLSNASYGFDTGNSVNYNGQYNRVASCTEYALAKGLARFKTNNTVPYWSRSPVKSSSKDVSWVNDNRGYMYNQDGGSGTSYVSDKRNGVRVCICLPL